jgi:hypothetical protein
MNDKKFKNKHLKRHSKARRAPSSVPKYKAYGKNKTKGSITEKQNTFQLAKQQRRK